MTSTTHSPPTRASDHVLTSDFAAGADQPNWWGLAASLLTEHDEALRIVGQVPEALAGTLYRNGPGRFDRGGLRKNHLLDGDGMIQAFRIAGGSVNYQNRFVRTAKYVAESQAHHFLYDTWTTRRPGASPSDPAAIESQAGVTVVHRNNTLYAIDDGPGIYELDPDSLATRGPASLDLPDGFSPQITAHTNLDPRTGGWTLVSGLGDRQQAVTLDRTGRCVHQIDVPLPRPVWLHDFLMTDRHLIFVCHPLHIDVEKFLGAGNAIWDAFVWQPANGNLVVVADRNGDAPPVSFETETAFSWHGLNAYTDNRTVVVDYVGYTDPDHAFGPDAQLRTAALGVPGNGHGPGTVRRLRLDLDSRKATESIYDGGGHEFPQVDPTKRNQRHRYGYFATTAPGEAVLPSGVARIDMDTGERDHFVLGAGQYCIEPIFARDTDSNGWLMTVVNDGVTGTAHLAIFNAEHLADGPVATAHLEHHSPFSFHGCWSPNRQSHS